MNNEGNKNVMKMWPKKYNLHNAVCKFCKPHFLIIQHIFMKKWWKCDVWQLVLIFKLTSFVIPTLPFYAMFDAKILDATNRWLYKRG